MTTLRPRRRHSCLGCLSVCVLSLAAAPAMAQYNANPITIETIVQPLTSPSGTARGFFVSVNLDDPRVEIVTTPPRAPGAASDSVLTRATDWQTANRVRLAINANFFSTVSGSNSDIIGLSMHDGALVSPVRQFGADPDPAIIFDDKKTPTVGFISQAQAATAWDAIAGVGPSNTDSVPGTLLVTDGVNTGATARVDPLNRNPRTAIGISADGNTLHIAIIDGRQAAWSDGMTLPELASLMIARGTHRAINLDGGGSTSMSYIQDDGTLLQNRPSDAGNVFRTVANHFGIAIRDGTTNYPGLTRPMRGAWLRPPTPSGTQLTTFESHLQTLAPAGIQDIFLETLYHGRDTGFVGNTNFPARFGFDYLAAAIPLANRYGVRIHAWCETGYLDFGTNPSALLTANPSWVVDHRDPANTTTGDQANQRFVNLGNPGVRNVLNAYFQSLTNQYPGLEGVQADYHFFPLAPSSAAPWSFDTWGINAYTAQYGVSPLTEVNTAATSYPQRWLDFNRENVSQALLQLRNASEVASRSPLFSAVAFSDWDGTIHRSKMIDLVRWRNSKASELFFVMAYFASTTSITNDLNEAKTHLPNRRIIAGLANLTSGTRPTVAQQLVAMTGAGLQDFAWFDAPTFVSNSAGSQATMRTELRAWIDGPTSTKLICDIAGFNGAYGTDGLIDARDLALFDATFTGTPVARTVANERLDFNGDYVIDENDRIRLRMEFGRFRFGEDGVVNTRDLTALQNAFHPGPAPFGTTGPLSLYDLDGDGDVDYDDQVILHGFLTVALSNDYDVNRDGSVTIADIYEQAGGNPIDIIRNGVIDANDIAALEVFLRSGEMIDMINGRREQ